jgi:hypothetical protein
LGNALKTTVQLLSSYNLRTIEELRAHKPQPEDKCEQIQQPTSYSGSRCLEPGCDYATRHPWKRREHCASAHKSSSQLPQKSEGDEKADVDLVRIINAAESVLRDAYALCSNTSADRKMTQQRANILNEFYAGASGRADGFGYYKNPLTLLKYFSTFKQLLVYFFRVVYYKDGHFTRTNPKQRLLG